MTAFIVIFAIALVISALLLTRVRFVIEYADELVLYLKILFYKKTLIPQKEKKIRISDYTKKKIQKRKNKDSEKKTAEKKTAKPEEKKEKRSIPETIRLVRVLLSVFLKRFFGHLKVEVARLNIRIAADDAAKTAISYGYICQGVAYIVELLDRFGTLKRRRSTEISVRPDFTAEKMSANIRIALSMSIAGALDVLFRTLFAYLKIKMKNITQKQKGI